MYRLIIQKKGGTEKVLSNKVNFFVNNYGYEIHIITEDQKDMPLGYDFDERVIFHDIGMSKWNNKYSIKGFTFLFNIFKLRKLYSILFNKIKPDIIVVCERGYLDYVIPFVTKQVPKIREFHFSREAVKVHASLMSPWIKRTKHLFLYKILFRMFNRYDYMALLTNRDKRNGRYKTNLEVIPNMMSSLTKEENISTLKNKKVISVGSMYDKRKRFDIQIKLWKEIVKIHPDWILDIYGDGFEKQNLKKLILDLDLGNNVNLHGNSDKMNEHYSEASIFLFTSMAEGLPMVLIEALSFGIPCIAYDCPTGPSDIIKTNVDGYVVEQGNFNELKDKVLCLIENEELRIEMGLQAKKNSERFLPEHVAELWKSLFEKLKYED